ncbi:hypothetical protein MKX01_041361 [Papaver californicum]|nr:hypothetical protein MKX01_041361 [Papaver californicum]
MNDLRDMVRGRRKKDPRRDLHHPRMGMLYRRKTLKVLEPVELTPEFWEAWRDKVPAGINRDIWHDFVDYEKKPEMIAKNATNA